MYVVVGEEICESMLRLKGCEFKDRADFQTCFGTRGCRETKKCKVMQS